MRPKILLIDDEEATRFGFTRFLSSSGFEVLEAGDIEGADRQLSSLKFDAVILDIGLPDGSGLGLIDRIRQDSPEIAIIVITGAGDIPLAVDAMRRGADNFLTKPVDMQGLEIFLKKSLEVGVIKKLHSSRQRLKKKEDMWIGESAAMQEILAHAGAAAENNAPVLITGETGTGKGVLARWIHNHSGCASFAFVDVNCSGLKGDLLARELFGNVRGAFTSAERDRDGLLDAADRGTLFLDEIGEMDFSVQSQFLKVLEEKTYRRLGDTKLQRSDFRLICATNKHIEEEVRNGSFRNDLLFRINLFTIHLPPLRERLGELPDLVRHLLEEMRSSDIAISEDALQMLKNYAWPGNIRELKNVLERARILSRGDTLTREHFSWLKSAALQPSADGAKTLEQIEHIHILSHLEKNKGDVTKTAKSLGISRATLYRRLKEMGEAT
ncbi:MAG: sigma-54 dependent transcriptional regulator [Desulfocapsaceae bacterium]|nr:sigma-54 dependent transcriptional regulator [Desulfocapsaceae bacterium]